MIFNKLISLIEQYSPTRKISLVSNISRRHMSPEMRQFAKLYHVGLYDVSNGTTVIVWHDKIRSYDDETMSVINCHLKNNNAVILVVPIDFDFHYFVRKCVSDSIDAISWAHADNKDNDHFYCIFIKVEHCVV